MNNMLAKMAVDCMKAGIINETELDIVLYSWASSRNLDTMEHFMDEFKVCKSYAKSVIMGTAGIAYDHKKSVEETVTEIGAAKDRAGALKGIKSMMPDIDRKINGWQHGLFYVIGGLKKTGKSRFVLSLASHWLKQGLGGIMFSLEMGTQKIHQCVFANRARVNTAVMGTGSITEQEYRKIVDEVNMYLNEHFYISKKSGISPDEMKIIIANVKTLWPVDFIIVDYIQRMKAKAESRTKEVERCALDLADIARDENVIMIALSQLSGEAEKHTGERAVYQYLKESQAILESADCGIMLYDKNRGILDNYKPDLNSKEIVAQIIQRDGESDISFILNAQLQYSFFGCSEKKHEDYHG